MATSVKADELVLPDILREHRTDIAKALQVHVPLVWRTDDEEKDVTFMGAESPRAIARVLIDAIHGELRNAQIAFLYRKGMKSRDRVTLGKASKAGPKLAYFEELDFLIEINWEYYVLLTREQRVALIDHELCHCAVDSEKEGSPYVLLHHDVEEFTAVVRRWGLWKTDVQRFAAEIENQRQLGLFDKEASKV